MTEDAEKQDPLQKLEFEELLARLESVVADMESGKLSLEKCLGRFEEGSKLATACGKRLTEVEKRVELLLKRDQDVEVRDFPEK